MNYLRIGLYFAALCLLSASAGATSVTTLNDEVAARVRKLSDSKCVRLLPFGRSEAGRAISAFVITDHTQPAEGKRRVFAIAGQHGNEPNPVRSVLTLCEELARGEHREIASTCVLVVIPLVNPDGAAVQSRTNSKRIDLNRDWSALRCAETRFVHGLISAWRPELLIDLHEWTAVGAAHPNSVETPFADATSRSQALGAVAHGIAGASGLASVKSGEYSDGSLFHRRYCALGYGTCLIETAAGRSSESKAKAYKSALLAAASALLKEPALGERLSPASTSFEVAAVSPYLDPVALLPPVISGWTLTAVLLGAYCLMIWVLRSTSRGGTPGWSRRFRRCLIEADVLIDTRGSRRAPQPITSRSWAKRRLRARYADIRH